MRLARLTCRLILFALLTIATVPFQLIVLCFTRGKASYIFPRLWHRCVTLIANTKVQVTGARPSSHHCFFVGNHISAMDIPMLGSILPASFAAKADVESYPLFGFLANIQQTVFISRKSSSAKIAQTKIRALLNSGKNLILFPEGTSTDGTYVVPFKSTLFSIPIEMADRNIVIQPFTLSLLSVEGSSDLTRERRNMFTLSPDVEFWQNFFSIMSLTEAVVNLHFHDPITVTANADRKILAETAYKAVVSALK